MLLVTDRQLQHSRDLIQRFRNRPGSQPTASGAENAELWRAKKMMCVHTHLPTPPAPPSPERPVTHLRVLRVGSSVVLLAVFTRSGRPCVRDSTIHPDTQQKIFLPLRMSAFVPVGVIFVLGMLRPNPSLASALGWQWANQSSNALINYANRNATADQEDNKAALRTMLESYAVAVGGSCGIAFSATRLLEGRGGALLPPAVRRTAALFVPLLSVCGANSFSLCVIRRRELQYGIDVADEAGVVQGQSLVAAKKAMAEMVLSRGVFLPSTVLGLPPVVMALLDRAVGWAPHSTRRLGAQAVTVIGALGVCLPLALAIFPQRGAISSERLEPEFRGEGGAPRQLYYNKGL